MDDIEEIRALSFVLERRLVEHGVIDKDKLVVLKCTPYLSCKIDGLIETRAELEGLLRIGAEIRRGKSFPAPVAAAARLMIEELCHAIFEPDDHKSDRKIQ